MPLVGLQYVSVVFPVHTHLLLKIITEEKIHTKLSQFQKSNLLAINAFTVKPNSLLQRTTSGAIRESPLHFENRIMPQVYIRSIRGCTMYQKAPFC